MEDEQNAEIKVPTDEPIKVPITRSPRRLTLKQRMFIREYIRRGGNGTQAALVAYDTKADVEHSIAT